ncbi:MAG: branched-chain amino acid ABC transporter permease [Alphaproteobacteria bacterium]|nr:branched-chain amino acid ABC transporter permease [Alphaproteobacteria bacterium]
MGSYELSLVTLAAIYAMLALSLNLITGFCGQISLGHAAFFGAGAYAAALLSKSGGPFVAALGAGMLVAALFGLVVGLASLRVRHDFLAITTMGVGFLFLGFVRKQKALGAELGISGIPDHGLGAWGLALLAVALTVATAILSLHIRRAWAGRAFAAIADDEDTARTMGIDVVRYKLVAFVMGTAIAGLAGGVFAHFTRFIIPDAFGFTVSISILAMVIVGGIGSTWGVLVGAVMLTLLPELFRFINDYKLLIYGSLLLLVMRFAPGGLAGALAPLFRRAGTAAGGAR